MRWGRPMPRGPVFGGVFYDDLVLACIVPTREWSEKTGQDFDLCKNAELSYAKAGLPLSTSKGFGFMREGGQSTADLEFVAWGTEVRSKEGLIGTERGKRVLLFYITMRVVSYGYVTGSFFLSENSLRVLCTLGPIAESSLPCSIAYTNFERGAERRSSGSYRMT